MAGQEERERRIRDERARIVRLERELQAARGRLDGLESDRQPVAELSVPEPAPSASSPSFTSPMGKVALFRRLFRGRADVFPTLWVNTKTGRKGYAPACSNEWKRGLCDKPRVRCGQCPSQAFVPVSDEAVLDHLQGRHVMGVYPLLPDESCWFVAADFDKDGWSEDVAAFRDTCVAFDLPVAIERSRSGNGAHAWLFFAETVAASEARKLACFLLTETMARRHQLSMRSYDRLFPNQDTMPKGGFGNLIALPLQHAARESGNTLFLDDGLSPLADQWEFLASLRRIPAVELSGLVAEAARKDGILAVHRPDPETGGATEPWAKPSAPPRTEHLPGPLPESVRAVLANGTFVESEGMPAVLLSRIKRLAAFQNPEFYKKQAMRFSTALTPRVISCAESLPLHVRLPRGCLDDLRQLLEANEVRLDLTDERPVGESLDVEFAGKLTEPQELAVETLLRDDIGILSAPPGAGKTVMGAALIARRGRSTLVVVHRKPLLEQWRAQLSSFLGLAPEAIGQIGGGKRNPTGLLDVAMLQSLAGKSDAAALVGNYGHLVVDECHHVAAVSFEKVLAEARARHVLGLTATPYRRDGHQRIITMQCGPVRHAMGSRGAASHEDLERHLIIRETAFAVDHDEEETGIQSVYAALAGDDARNDLILDDVIGALEQGHSPLVLTERRDHLDYLATKLRSFCRHLVVLHGGLKPKARREAMELLATVPDSEERLILATGRYIGEGFDDARLDALFLTMPVSWKGTLVQYAGRLHRSHPGKTAVRIHDYHDAAVPVLARMFRRRLARLKALGYAPRPAPPGPDVGSDVRHVAD